MKKAADSTRGARRFGVRELAPALLSEKFPGPGVLRNPILRQGPNARSALECGSGAHALARGKFVTALFAARNLTPAWAGASFASTLIVFLLSYAFPGLLGAGLLRASPNAQHPPPPAVTAAADTPELHLAQGHEDLKNNRYQQAEREFRAALALDPHLTVRARFPLAVTLFNLQERGDARQQLEMVRSETGDDPNVNYYLGRLDLMEGQLDAAIHNLTLASAQPPFPDAAYYLGYAYLKKGDLSLSEQWLQRAAALAPRDARVHLRLGNLYQALGRKDEAQKAFAASSALHEQDIVATQLALDCRQSLDIKPLPEAREVCRKLIDPDDVGKLVSLGTLYGQHGDYADALEPFRLAAEANPYSYEMQYNLGLTYFRLKRYAEARGPLEKAVALRPDIFEINAPLGATLYTLGDDLAAYRVLDHAHRLNPHHADVSRLLFQLSLMLAKQSFQKKSPAQTREYLMKAAALRPHDPEPHRRLAEVYESMGEHSSARRERELAKSLASH